ncbi:MAG: tetratricopeptide repeat protein [Candidatus Bathyarchaeia archaeon]
MDYRNKQDNGQKDYLAAGVFFFVLLVLIVSIVIFIRETKWDFINRPLDFVSQWREEIKKYKEYLVERLGDIPSLSRKEHSASWYIHRGYQSYRKGNFLKALQDYDKAIKLDPQNPVAYFWRGRTCLKMEQYDRAISDLKRAVELKPDYPEAYDNLGWLCGKIGKYDDAISYLTRSIELKPQNSWAYFMRGQQHFRKGDIDNALRDTEKACQFGLQDGCKLYEELKKKGENKGRGN